MAVDRQAAARALRDFLVALGHPPEEDPELQDTPYRVTDAFANELLAGYSADIPALLAEGSPPNTADPVILRGLRVATVCPHHLLPGLGTAVVAYQPGARLLGIGVLARLVDAYARRLTLQERIVAEVVTALLEHGGARAAYCRLDLLHTCLAVRGARQSEARATVVRAGGAWSQGLPRLLESALRLEATP